LLQPHDLYPMRQKEFDHWVDILRTHFPDSPRLRDLGVSFVCRTPEEALRLMEIQVQECRHDERLREYTATFQKTAEQFRAMIARPDDPTPWEAKQP
jgi:hypothetical protein